MRSFLALLALLLPPGALYAGASVDFSNSTGNLIHIATLPDTAHITLACWVKSPSVSAIKQVWANDNLAGAGCGASRVWQFRLESDGRVGWIVFRTSVTVVASSGQVDDSTWHHIAGTYDGAAARIYIDGAADGSTAGVGSLQTIDSPSCIGGEGSAGILGSIAHCSSHSRALSPAELQSMAAGSPPPAGGLLVYLPLWDAGTPFDDVGPLGLDGTCTTCPDESSDGPPVFLPGGAQ